MGMDSLTTENLGFRLCFNISMFSNSNNLLLPCSRCKRDQAQGLVEEWDDCIECVDVANHSY